MGTRTATYLTAILLLGFLAGCEKSIDPATGATTTRATIPGTANKDAAWQERWQRCIQFRSESFCRRSVPGGIPPGAAGGGPTEEQTPAEEDE